MHAASRHGTPSLTSHPKDDEGSCEVRPPRSPIRCLTSLDRAFAHGVDYARILPFSTTILSISKGIFLTLGAAAQSPLSPSRFMTMSPLYPCDKPCSRRTQNDSEKSGPIFFNHQWNYDGIMALNLNPIGVFSILQSNRKFYHIYSVTIVIHKSRNLIGTGGIAKFGPKKGQVFHSNTMSLYCPKRHHQVKEHRATRDSSS